MLTCQWAQALTHYDCRQMPAIHGGQALEIGTPFSLPDGSAIVLYLLEHGSQVLVSDNGDTIGALASMGIRAQGARKKKALHELAKQHGMALAESGDFRRIAALNESAFAFAQTIGGLLAIGEWAAEQVGSENLHRDLAAEAEPYILARNPALELIRKFKVKGASRQEHEFDFLHGLDLIDVKSPKPTSTAFEMRKLGDVLNGPYLQGRQPLVIVDDRDEPEAAVHEMAIMGSMARAMRFTELTRLPMH